MPIATLFPTRVYSARLQTSNADAFNARLLRECAQYRADDVAGQAWSRERYPGGYTSYGSLNRMHTLSPTFAQLERKLRRHVQAYARALYANLRALDESGVDAILVEQVPDDHAWDAVRDRLARATAGIDDDRD